MNLDLMNSTFSKLNENKFIQNFIAELSNNLENNLDLKNKENPIIEDILSKNNLTTGNKNSIIWNQNEVILKYAKENFNNDLMYFIKDNKKTYWLNNKKHYNNEVYAVLKVENDKIEETEISKNNMPKGIGINDVFQIKSDKYILDSIATKELKDEITKMAEKIIEKQNNNLEKHRKEGHLYMVTEELGNNRFLKDLSNSSKHEFEEVNIPKELLNKATEGKILKYSNGKYEYYSDYGYESE